MPLNQSVSVGLANDQFPGIISPAQYKALKLVTQREEILPLPTGDVAIDTATLANISTMPAGTLVVCPGPGTYLINQTVARPEHVVVDGVYPGRDRLFASTIKAAPGSNLDAVVADKKWLAGSTSTGDCGGWRNLIIDGGYFSADGSTVLQSSGMLIGLVAASFRFMAEHLMIQNTGGDGLRLSGYSRNGTPLTTVAVENVLDQCDVRNYGLANLPFDPISGLGPGTEGIAIRDGAGVVTDWFILCCNVNNDRVPTGSGSWNIMNGTAIWVDNSSGGLAFGNHTYSSGKGGYRFDRGNDARIVGNYVESFGQLPNVGEVVGMFFRDVGSAPTQSQANSIDLGSQNAVGNQYVGAVLENAAGGGPASFGIGMNTFRTSVVGGTAMRIRRNGSSGLYSIALSPQAFSGAFAHWVDVDSGVALSTQASVAWNASLTPDPGRADTYFVTPGASGTTQIRNPSTGVGGGAAGMRLTFCISAGASPSPFVFGTNYHLGNAADSPSFGSSGGTITLAAGEGATLMFVAASSGTNWRLQSIVRGI